MVVLMVSDLAPLVMEFPASKYCGGCDELKAASEFFASSSSDDGLQTQCKDCERKRHRRWYAAGGEVIERRKEANRKRAREYWKTHQRKR